jgi:hypothetical protein
MLLEFSMSSLMLGDLYEYRHPASMVIGGPRYSEHVVNSKVQLTVIYKDY